MFDDRAARDDLRKYRSDGPTWATRELIDELADGIALDGATVIDIGAGVGAVHLGLLARGARAAVDVDGSSAYVAAARGEAERQGVADRVTHLLGDATVLAPTLEPADLVALDRVVCCFPDVDALLGAASSLAGRRIGLVYPRDRWWIRAGATLANPVFFARSAGYRIRIHRQAVVAALLAGAGFDRIAERDGRVWRIETWERVPAGREPGAAAPYGAAREPAGGADTGARGAGEPAGLREQVVELLARVADPAVVAALHLGREGSARARLAVARHARLVGVDVVRAGRGRGGRTLGRLVAHEAVVLVEARVTRGGRHEAAGRVAGGAVAPAPQRVAHHRDRARADGAVRGDVACGAVGVAGHLDPDRRLGHGRERGRGRGRGRCRRGRGRGPPPSGRGPGPR